MASRCRSISRPAVSFLKSSMRKTISPLSPNLLTRPVPSFPRVPRAMGSLQSLLPFHSAVSSARLTSRLGIDSTAGSRSLSQGTLCSSNPGV
ncbi:protein NONRESPONDING TO OXYLIPINS 2, mitochondrial [Phoenix dactylifera]|uniref:Protein NONRESPONDING TO OXYLIPINS 2, mitochondrial n=1 Tax=Phoenix dactylifera TaxID=42345 RepID=A0A8B7CRU8_PHODC|nr:protein NONRESPONDING TO OXYLIPINS 2, mitochondrial [Phoenix dactylifera]